MYRNLNLFTLYMEKKNNFPITLRSTEKPSFKSNPKTVTDLWKGHTGWLDLLCSVNFFSYDIDSEVGLPKTFPQK